MRIFKNTSQSIIDINKKDLVAEKTDQEIGCPKNCFERILGYLSGICFIIGGLIITVYSLLHDKNILIFFAVFGLPPIFAGLCLISPRIGAVAGKVFSALFKKVDFEQMLGYLCGVCFILAGLILMGGAFLIQDKASRELFAVLSLLPIFVGLCLISSKLGTAVGKLGTAVGKVVSALFKTIDKAFASLVLVIFKWIGVGIAAWIFYLMLKKVGVIPVSIIIGSLIIAAAINSRKGP